MHHPAFTSGQTAVISGAASGIGLATVQALAARGMAVVMFDLPGDRLTAAARNVTDQGAKVLAIGFDVGDAPAWVAAAAQVAADMPPVTFLMNNAGMGEPSSALGHPEAWARTLQTNLWGVINGTQAFVPAMLAHGWPGMVVNTGSKQGITSPPGNPAYNASKAGVKSFTEALAHELRNTPGGQISAHLMIPGWVHTGMTAVQGGPKPEGAWTTGQVTTFMFAALDRGDFYILCPDNDVSRELDAKRIAWAAGDLIENRPALSRWHPDFAQAFNDSLKGL
jgi:NAD(P)-dependent dehydrogenase (short-subunit alcohol dehydrogenase family)